MTENSSLGNGVSASITCILFDIESIKCVNCTVPDRDFWFSLVIKCVKMSQCLGLNSAICPTFQFWSGPPISVWRNSWNTRFLLSFEIPFCSFVLDMGQLRKTFEITEWGRDIFWILTTQCTINSLMFRCESCPDFVRLVVCFLESVTELSVAEMDVDHRDQSWWLLNCA